MNIISYPVLYGVWNQTGKLEQTILVLTGVRNSSIWCFCKMVGSYMTRIEAYAQLLMGKLVSHSSIPGDPWSLTPDRRIVIDFGNLEFTAEFMNFTIYKDGWSLYVKT